MKPIRMRAQRPGSPGVATVQALFSKGWKKARGFFQALGKSAGTFPSLGNAAFVWLACGSLAAGAAEAPDVAALRAEVRGLGWLVFAARSAAGDYDLFLCRPDGSALRNLTQTPDANEAYPLFSRDGTRLLYRRLARTETINGNDYGTQGRLCLARADGAGAQTLGGDGEFPWASWSPDGRQLLCLAPQGFQIVDLASRKVVRTLPRAGFFQQPTWSPDGRAIVGVANAFGESWSIGRMDMAGGAASAVHVQDCCTPDWFPDSAHIIFSWRPAGQTLNKGYGWTQLWRKAAKGGPAQLVLAEEGRHIYGGHVSPDGRYVICTGNMQEDGDPAHSGAPMSLMRLCDAPLIIGANAALRTTHPAAKSGPVLALPVGWEPCWTLRELPAGGGGAKP